MIKWGVLGYGNIAQRFIQGLSYSQNGQLYAVATMTPSKKEDCLKKHPDICVYDSYEDLLNDDNIDAVYIALRHGDHYQWSKEALKRHIAVLCEKPATLSYQQTLDLCTLSKENHVFFMEAMKTRFIPLINDIKICIQEGKLGKIQHIKTSFCSDVSYQPHSYLFDSIQGGALYDVGIYNILFLLDCIQSNCEKIKVKSRKKYDVDAYDYIELLFEDGEKGIVECGIDCYYPRELEIQGENGILKAEPFYRPTDMTIIYQDGTKEILHKDYQYDDFYGEIEEVHRCLENNQYQSLRMCHADSLKAIALIERIREDEQWLGL